MPGELSGEMTVHQQIQQPMSSILEVKIDNRANVGRKATGHVFTWWVARAEGGRKHRSVPRTGGLWLVTAVLLSLNHSAPQGPTGASEKMQ